ncbi:MAG TPA: YdcF family protein [Candidatus Acidoferrum sp.]|jgi:uncharacterized SAM-binding protein YcdF (DUF218 family)
MIMFSKKGERGGAIASLISFLFLVALCAIIYFARHPIMKFAAESWIVNEPAARADAVVVMSDDNFYADRATEAAQLFRQGIAPIVVASGRRLRPSADMSELTEHDLIERGVPKEKILRFPNDADAMIDQVTLVEKFAVEHGWKKLLVVTSNYQTRRTRYIFQKTAPHGLEISVASARDGDFDPELWWEKRKSIKDFINEVVGMLDTMWELRGARQSGAA